MRELQSAAAAALGDAIRRRVVGVTIYGDPYALKAAVHAARGKAAYSIRWVVDPDQEPASDDAIHSLDIFERDLVVFTASLYSDESVKGMS
jgi:hypothetical protein